MIIFRNISKFYPPDVFALKDVNIKVSPGEFISIAGPSGAGKSTLIKLLIREELPTSGEILIGNINVNKLKNRELSYLRRKVGIIFQDFKLLPEKNVYENVAFAMEMCGLPQIRIFQDVPRVLKIVGLLDKINNLPHQLSGGEKQRAATARALIHKPEILIADEPTGNLDPINTYEIVKLLLKINELGTTVILASHHKDVINSLEKRVVTLNKGQVIRDEPKGKYIV